jgi:hypothetical protein
MRFEKITFFRPDEVVRERSSLSAEVYNRTRLLLRRSPADCQFVPIRSMQYQGVITEDEIIFVDSQGYAVRDGEGGRVIVQAWQICRDTSRSTLSEPAAIDIVCYREPDKDLQRRLLGEFDNAMSTMLERQLQDEQPHPSLKVVPIKR